MGRKCIEKHICIPAQLGLNCHCLCKQVLTGRSQCHLTFCDGGMQQPRSLMEAISCLQRNGGHHSLPCNRDGMNRKFAAKPDARCKSDTGLLRFWNTPRLRFAPPPPLQGAIPVAWRSQFHGISGRRVSAVRGACWKWIFNYHGRFELSNLAICCCAFVCRCPDGLAAKCAL
jgi:hypothetical protein